MRNFAGLLYFSSNCHVSQFGYPAEINERELADFYLGSMIVGEGRSQRGIAFNGWSKIVDNLRDKYIDNIRKRCIEEIEYIGRDPINEENWVEWFEEEDDEIWAEIAELYLKLKNTTGTWDVAILIDHINDLQHHSGNWAIGDYEWMPHFLDVKRDDHKLLIPLASKSWLEVLAYDNPEIFDV